MDRVKVHFIKDCQKSEKVRLMSTITLERRGENFFGHVILRSVLSPIDEPDCKIVQQLIILGLLVGRLQVR
jgi:hypothetical protein